MAEILYNGVLPCISVVLGDITRVTGGSTDATETGKHDTNWGTCPSAVVKPEPEHWLFSSAPSWLCILDITFLIKFVK